MSTDRLWGIVLAGAAGLAWRRRTADRRGPRPAAHHALFRRTVDRANRLIPAERLVAVLARDHPASYDTALGDLPEVERVVQPAYRGTAPALFLSVLKIAQRDPHATVAVLPGDEAIEGDARLMRHVARAAAAVAVRPDLPIVIGAVPGGPGWRAPWIEPGPPAAGLEAHGVRLVRRFATQPSPAEQADLTDRGGLVNTQVVVARVEALIALGRHTAPDVLETLEPLEETFGAPEERLLSEAVYEQMPYANLSRVLFVRPGRVGVLPAADLMVLRDPVPLPHALAS